MAADQPKQVWEYVVQTRANGDSPWEAANFSTPTTDVNRIQGDYYEALDRLAAKRKEGVRVTRPEQLAQAAKALEDAANRSYRVARRPFVEWKDLYEPWD